MMLGLKQILVESASTLVDPAVLLERVSAHHQPDFATMEQRRLQVMGNNKLPMRPVES